MRRRRWSAWCGRGNGRIRIEGWRACVGRMGFVRVMCGELCGDLVIVCDEGVPGAELRAEARGACMNVYQALSPFKGLPACNMSSHLESFCSSDPNTETHYCRTTSTKYSSRQHSYEYSLGTPALWDLPGCRWLHWGVRRRMISSCIFLDQHLLGVPASPCMGQSEFMPCQRTNHVAHGQNTRWAQQEWRRR